MSADDRPVVWLETAVKTPPMSAATRLEAGYLLRRLQRGDRLGMPYSRPMPSIGKRVHELRITDGESRAEWRIVYRLDVDAVVVADVFRKTTRATPARVMERCQGRLRDYDTAQSAER